jgi:hypothetical protein
MNGQLLTVAETRALIQSGSCLLLAGDEALLSQLPAGSWIGGTIPYFMTADGGTTSRDLIYVDQLPSEVTYAGVSTYEPDELHCIPADGFANGFSVVILPANSEAHLRYAAEAPDYPGLFDRPVVGWVSGVHLDDLGQVSPKVFAGGGGTSSDRHAVVLHAALPAGSLASANIVNLFSQGEGPTLTFDETGFVQAKVNVDGVPQELASYLQQIDHDVRLPLVADYFGANVNVSFQRVPDDGGPVELYAPVFSGIDYKLAAPVSDYVSEFAAKLPSSAGSPAFSCNCVLNYLYSELEGKKTGNIGGPMTFGEIAFQLLNQTLVYLTIHT